MFLNLILSHIPRTLKAAVALVILLGGSSISLAGLTQVVVGSAHTMDWLKIVFGTVVTVPATIIFYMEQSRSTQVKGKADIETETLSRYGEILKPGQQSADIKAWNMDDPKDGPKS